MDYDKTTQNLIDRMCLINERKDFILKKKEAQELLFKTYELFDLPRPKKVKWCVDIFDKKFQDAARSARSAWSASSASSASSAWSAWSARSARSAWSARSASSAWSALDYDFDWFVAIHEYNKANSDGNENDKKYLEYCKLLIEAKELGAGYWVEWEDTLYLVPTPIVSIDAQQRFSSTEKPAIYWKGGDELFYISGTEFDKKLWKKVVSGKMKAQEVFAIENMEQRRIAYEQMDKLKMKQLPNYEVLDEVEDDGYKNPMKLISFTLKDYDTPFYYLNCFCPSTGREYFLETREKACWAAKMVSFGLSEEDRFVSEW